MTGVGLAEDEEVEVLVLREGLVELLELRFFSGAPLRGSSKGLYNGTVGFLGFRV